MDETDAWGQQGHQDLLLMTPDEANWSDCAIIPSLATTHPGWEPDMGYSLNETRLWTDIPPPIVAWWAYDNATGEHGLLVQFTGIIPVDGFWLTIFC